MPTYHPHYVGATIDKRNFDFMPAHRSGNAAVSESWDLLTRRIRWAIDNTYMIRRACKLMVQLVVESGINCIFAGLPDVTSSGAASDLLADPMFQFGEESDDAFRRWADKYACVKRRQSLWELQATSVGDLFGSGNSLWLKVVRPAPEGVCPVAYQLLEAEQLDDSRDRPRTATTTRIERGIEYNQYDEPIAYWLFDSHPYDTQAVFRGYGASQRIPANRVIHLALTTRASQDFGVSFANIILQPSHDEDWLVGHELTSAAIAAGLTLLIKEGEEEDGSIPFDSDAAELSPPAAYQDAMKAGVPEFSEIGLSAGSVARCRVSRDFKEAVEIVESKRPNKDVEPFARFLMNRASMAASLSYHRYTGNPTGASFATLRAMINDDRAMSEPVTNAVGRLIARRPREVHDGTQAALGRYRTVTAAQYSANLPRYQDFDVLGPPLRHLNPNEDVDSAAKRIRIGISTLRRECGLLNLNYRAVLRQLAVEKNLAAALGVVLDFSSGGGSAPSRTTTAAETKQPSAEQDTPEDGNE
jgi:capsid protein